MSLHAIVLPTDERQERRSIDVSPDGIFKPCAILLWGAKPGSLIHQLTVIDVALFAGALPAVMFEAEVGWEHFRSASVPCPHHPHPVVEPKDIGRFFRLDCPAAAPGQIITLDLEGQLEHAALLGRMLPVALPAPEPGVLLPAPGFDAHHSRAIRARMNGQQQ